MTEFQNFRHAFPAEHQLKMWRHGCKLSVMISFVDLTESSGASIDHREMGGGWGGHHGRESVQLLPRTSEFESPQDLDPPDVLITLETV